MSIAIPQTMRAAWCTAYGAPDVIENRTVALPTPKENEILVRIGASVVTAADAAMRKGDLFLIRMMFGFSKPRNPIMGSELAGTVVAVGEKVTRYRIGDRVMGATATGFVAHAEYAVLPEDATFTRIPDNLTFDEAASICDGAPTALVFLRDYAKVTPGMRLLINGASGAVGSAGVQIAKHYGAHVTAICSERNLALVKSLGADKVIDYRKVDFATTGETWDVIFDAIGKRSFGNVKQALTPRGKYLTTVPTLHIVGSMATTALGNGKKARLVTAGLIQKTENFDYLAELAKSGELRPVIDRTYPLYEIVDAHRYVDTERKRGSVVIQIDG